MLNHTTKQEGQTQRIDQDIELRPALERGFWEMWVADHFVGMYYSIERAKQAASSCYAEAMRGKYGSRS